MVFTESEPEQEKRDVFISLELVETLPVCAIRICPKEVIEMIIQHNFNNEEKLDESLADSDENEHGWFPSAFYEDPQTPADITSPKRMPTCLDSVCVLSWKPSQKAA